jgi:hypothetical protein
MERKRKKGDRRSYPRLRFFSRISLFEPGATRMLVPSTVASCPLRNNKQPLSSPARLCLRSRSTSPQTYNGFTRNERNIVRLLAATDNSASSKRRRRQQQPLHFTRACTADALLYLYQCQHSATRNPRQIARAVHRDRSEAREPQFDGLMTRRRIRR